MTARAARAGRTGVAFGHAEVFALLGAASFLAARFLPVLGTGFTCPVKAALGIPCLTCGMTHAFVFLAHGRVLDALQASPAGALLAAAAWLFALLDAARLALGVPLPALPPRRVRPAVVAGGLALLVSWVYVLARGST